MVDITKIDTFIRCSPNPALATRQGRCVYANPALQRFTGLNLDQISQADWSAFLLEEDRAVASASWRRSLATGTPYRVKVCSQPLDRFRVRGSQLCRLLLLLVVSFNQWPLLFGQTPPSARVHVNHNSWTFSEGAPADVACLAHTNDGFLWLVGPNGLVPFDGTRFEPFRSPFGDPVSRSKTQPHSPLNHKRYFRSATAPPGMKAPLILEQIHSEGGTLAFLIRFPERQIFAFGGMNYIEREIAGLEPDVVLVGAGASKKETYDYSGRLMRDLHYQALVLTTHWDNFLLPYEASQEPALELRSAKSWPKVKQYLKGVRKDKQRANRAE